MPSIDPFRKKPSSTPDERLARATGKPLPQVPVPAAGLPPGVTGNPPLPVGRPVTTISPGDLTEAERTALGSIGWKEGEPIPRDMAAILEQAVKEHLSAAIPLPVDPTAPPLKVNTVDLKNLPPEKQQEILARARASAAAESAQHATTSRQAEATVSRTQGMSEAVSAADQAVAAFRAKSMPQPSDEPLIAPPTPAVPPTAEAAPSPPPPPPPPATETKAATKSDTGADAQLSHCPHCNWDLALPDIPEPPYADRMAYLHSLLGMKPHLKSYDIFGGNMSVTLRTLTTREIDIVYKQAYRDREMGGLPNEMDYWERINRYRLLLQLVGLRTASKDGFFHELPDGYSKSTNPGASGVWVDAERESIMAAEAGTPGADATTLSETGLPAIESWITENVLKTEAIFRAVMRVSSEFNRLMSKMEAMADNSDFWSPTGAPSS